MARLPDQIGKYNVVERIGKGGMGMVYKAQHPTLDRSVILKKLNISGDPVMRERFRREAEIMIDFRTDYVVDVYDHFKHGSSDYIVLEYVDGVSLDELLAQERYLPSDLALFIIRDCFRGLAYVHGKGVVHRDMKPGNVLIGRDGAVKLLDFGIASRVTGFQDELTRDGMTLGTVAYIAPEQIERSRDVDKRADIYSTGAMLYEMVTGRKAFAGGFNPETVNRIQRGRYRRPRRVNPRVSRLAARIVNRSMKRKPGRRYQQADRVVTILDDYFRRRGEAGMREELARLAGGSGAKPTISRRRRRWWPRLTAALVVLLIAGGAAGWITGGVQRLLLGRTHALAQIEVRLRKGEREIPEHLIRTRLARAHDDEAVDVPLRLPFLRAVASLETPDYVVLRSRLFTLPAGRYRSTMRAEGTTLAGWSSLPPLDVSAEVHRFTIQWDPLPPRELQLEVEVYDQRSGERLTTGARPATGEADPQSLAIWVHLDEWRRIVRRVDGWYVVTDPTAFTLRESPLARTLAGRLNVTRTGGLMPLALDAGGAVELRFEHPDYLPVRMAVDTSEASSVLRVRAELVPRPATVLINSRLEEAELLVNDSRWISSAGGDAALVAVPSLYSGVTELELAPGHYRLEVRADGETDAVRLSLERGATAVLRLEYGSGDEIDLAIVEGGE